MEAIDSAIRMVKEKERSELILQKARLTVHLSIGGLKTYNIKHLSNLTK